MTSCGKGSAGANTLAICNWHIESTELRAESQDAFMHADNPRLDALLLQMNGTGPCWHGYGQVGSGSAARVWGPKCGDKSRNVDSVRKFIM